MSNTKHTPGPWHRGTSNYGSPFLVAREETGFVVAEACNRHHSEEAEANARLMAAAPELLKLAEEVAKLNPLQERIGPGMMATLLEMANSAIAKATGTNA
jgi:hypothetical protein